MGKMLVQFHLPSRRRPIWTLVFAWLIIAFLYLTRQRIRTQLSQLYQNSGNIFFENGKLIINSNGSPQHAGSIDTAASADSKSPTAAIESAKDLWRKLQPLLEEYKPQIPEVRLFDAVNFESYDAGKLDMMEDLTGLNSSQIIRIRDTHQKFVSSMHEVFPNYTHPTNSARRGLVITASKAYLPMTFVALRMLKRTGTTIPVEVWINQKNEHEPRMCEMLRTDLQMDADCRIMEEVFNQEEGRYAPKSFIKFEYKIFALLFSSFEDILYMDADNLILHPPEELFESDPFRRTGMVMWPDFWRQAVSPSYYLINGRRPHHLGMRSAAESGQMMFSKKTHLHTLLLAAYYNYHGESHYYSLLNQDGPGKGDKDTFIPAAETLGLPFWQVREPATALGHKGNGLVDPLNLAIIQWDPRQDFYRHRNETTGNIFSPSAQQSDVFDDGEPPRMYFLHCNTRKWNPKDVLSFSGGYDLAWDHNAHPVKAYTHPEDVAGRLGYTERIIWDEVRWVACSEVNFQDWEGRGDEICDSVSRYYDTALLRLDDVEPFTPQGADDRVAWWKSIDLSEVFGENSDDEEFSGGDVEGLEAWIDRKWKKLHSQEEDGGQGENPSQEGGSGDVDADKHSPDAVADGDSQSTTEDAEPQGEDGGNDPDAPDESTSLASDGFDYDDEDDDDALTAEYSPDNSLQEMDGLLFGEEFEEPVDGDGDGDGDGVADEH